MVLGWEEGRMVLGRGWGEGRMALQCGRFGKVSQRPACHEVAES